VRMWRNWQTRMVQVHVLAREWRFKSSHPHHKFDSFPALYSINDETEPRP
jgi:hypothetical protein